MKRVTAAVLAALQFAGLTNTAWSQSGHERDFIAAVKSMQRSVAPVMCVRAVQPQLQPLPLQQTPAPSQLASPQLQPSVAGTAFFLTRRGDFVTAASVLANFLEPGALAGCTMMIWFTSPVDAAGNFSTQGFIVALKDCVVDPDIDAARCRTIGDLTKAWGGRFAPVPVAFEDGQPDVGTSVGTTGFILFDTVPISSRGHIGGYQPAAPAAAQMVLDWPAGAGSPVYDSHGKVVGMVAQARNLILTTISVASTSLVLSRFLAAHPIENK
ncbi:MAG TPA: hypothetical protein VHX61_00115 [Rhizomicrobium sp.]|jgi:hypothetical protein|nr:hypothetical protein [Rhizomicrobium sp.]